MGVVQAKIQTVEDVYRLIRMAVLSKRPIRAVYDGHDRWFCPHRLGWNREGRIRVLCYQYGGEATADCNRLVHRKTGVASHWRNSAE
jgi:hypothetical protein